MDVEGVVGTLGLDSARIVAKASATEDYARILIQRAVEDSAAAEAWRVRAASAQTIAGSLWLLVRPPAAFALLGRAEEIHDTIGSAYGSVLGICAHPHRPSPAHPLPHNLGQGVWTAHADDPTHERSHEPEAAVARLQPAASLLAHLWPLAAGQSDEPLERLLSDAPILETLPGHHLTGRLRIPLAHYRNLATEIDRLRHGERTPRDPLRAAGAFLDRAAEAIGAARENRHQWHTLRSPILPAEPEVLAACALVELTARDIMGVSAIDEIDASDNDLARALMGVAQNLLDADADAPPEAVS